MNAFEQILHDMLVLVLAYNIIFAAVVILFIIITFYAMFAGGRVTKGKVFVWLAGLVSVGLILYLV